MGKTKTKKQKKITSKCEDDGSELSPVKMTDIKLNKKIKKEHKQALQHDKSSNDTITSTSSSFLSKSNDELKIKRKRKAAKLDTTKDEAPNEEIEEKLVIPDEDNSELNNVANAQRVKMNVDEEEFDQNELDAYCDDVTEEDNALYLNWVQLLEEKLHSKKSEGGESTKKTEVIKKKKSSKEAKAEQPRSSKRPKKKELAT